MNFVGGKVVINGRISRKTLQYGGLFFFERDVSFGMFVPKRVYTDDVSGMTRIKSDKMYKKHAPSPGTDAKWRIVREIVLNVSIMQEIVLNVFCNCIKRDRIRRTVA